MADYSRTCDIHQGFSFQHDNQDTIGYITALKVGDKDLDVDMEVNTPEGKQEKVVSVLSGISHEVATTNPISFSGQVSVKNRQALAQMVYSNLAKIKVELKFVVWEFDPAKDQNKYFKGLHSNSAAVKGLIRKSGKALELSVDHSPNSEVQSPLNYGFSITVVPTPEKQSLELAVSVNGKIALTWSNDAP